MRSRAARPAKTAKTAKARKLFGTDGVRGVANLEPMQLAALLLEKTTERLSRDEVEELVRARQRGHG